VNGLIAMTLIYNEINQTFGGHVKMNLLTPMQATKTRVGDGSAHAIERKSMTTLQTVFTDSEKTSRIDMMGPTLSNNRIHQEAHHQDVRYHLGKSPHLKEGRQNQNVGIHARTPAQQPTMLTI
jgi:hypothetical protein